MKNLPPFPILTINERISLREHEPSDAEAFFNYYTHSQVTEFNIAAPTPKTVQEAREEVMYCRSLYYQRQGIYWAICEQSNPLMIGAIGVHLRSHHHGEIHRTTSGHLIASSRLPARTFPILSYRRV